MAATIPKVRGANTAPLPRLFLVKTSVVVLGFQKLLSAKQYDKTLDHDKTQHSDPGVIGLMYSP